MSSLTRKKLGCEMVFEGGAGPTKTPLPGAGNGVDRLVSQPWDEPEFGVSQDDCDVLHWPGAQYRGGREARVGGVTVIVAMSDHPHREQAHSHWACVERTNASAMCARAVFDETDAVGVGLLSIRQA